MGRTSKPQRPQAAPRAKPSAESVVNVALDVGDWLDVMDAEGTWNVAQVLSVLNSKEVEVKYDGWGTEYNEVVVINSDRVAPYQTYTWSVVCWAKYKNWPWWPSIVTIRSPGTLAGQTYLEKEKRLFVDFMDGKDIQRRCRCWVDQSKVQPFSKLEDERRRRSTGSDFEASLARVHLSSATKTFPKFVKGTLPNHFRSEIATPVSVLRKEWGVREWAKSLISNRERHRRVYMYKLAGGVALTDDEDDDGDEGQVVQFVDISDDDDDAPKKPRVGSKAKGSTKPKSVKKENTSKKPKARRADTLAEDVVKIEHSEEIIEGPHAPSPNRETREQPLFLPPIEEQIGANAPPPEEDDGHVQSSADTSTSLGSGTPSLKRTRQELAVASSVDAATVLEPTAERMNIDDDSIDVHLEDCSDFAFEPGTTTVEENSEETVMDAPPVTSRDDTAQEADDQALVMDIDKNDDSGAESDLIPLDPVEDVGVEPPLDPEGVDQAEVVRASPVSPQQITSIHEQEVVPVVGSHDAMTLTAATLHELQTDEALVVRQEAPHSVASGPSPTLQSDVATAPPKPPKSSRKSAKSLADETIAVAQAALAELDNGPAPSKKARTDKGVKSSSFDSNIQSSTPTQCVGKPSSNPVDPVESSDASSTLLATALPPPQPDATATESGQDERGTSRRSRMRADVDGGDAALSTTTSGETQRKLRGKTPVWVMPPPKFDASSLCSSSPVSTTSILSAPAFPPPFSSLSLFGSTVDFSMRKWFKEDKYPHYLSQ